jgi:lysophospholipid acyltransferase (LPLAT)-like uncharacterized protein
MDSSTDASSTAIRTRDSVTRAYSFANLSQYSPSQRFLIKLADLTFYFLIGAVGLTIRWKVTGQEHLDSVRQNGSLPILTFWHNRIFLATYFFRHRRIVVMTSRSFDGEYIARFIQRFGYGAARGSSTRGGIGAVVEMVKLMRAGCPTGFSIDGPKGPRYVAKMGAVLLAKKTGNPIVPFSISASRSLTINSWDQLQIPLPFTKALISIGEPIYVSKDATEEELRLKRDELQQSLDDLCARGDEWRSKA